jgi:cell division protein FtsZ
LSNNVLKFGVQSITDLMVKPGLVNCDFADVETIMKGMGKAMMGTGEAEGENRAEDATNAALYNPLIDEYSLRGAKGLLLNITGGSDLTLFEVDYISNKIRAEVDSAAEIIFGSIEDESLNGKIRVSIVATSLDGQEPETKPVVSMVHRLQNRNVGYSDNVVNTLASKQATLNATEGATALNIDQTTNQDKVVQKRSEQEEIKKTSNDFSFENISIENATYLQNVENTLNDKDFKANDDEPNFEVDSIELVTPELFSDDGVINSTNDEKIEKQDLKMFENTNLETDKEIKEQEMFEDTNLEEDFEIPAFLRRQKN